jgi:hypothetical protein
MSPHPKTTSPLRRLARKILPLPVRGAFGWAVDSIAWRDRDPGQHHRHTAVRARGQHAKPVLLPMPGSVRNDEF